MPYCEMHDSNTCGGPHRMVLTEIGQEVLGPGETPVGTNMGMATTTPALMLSQRITALEELTANIPVMTTYGSGIFSTESAVEARTYLSAVASPLPQAVLPVKISPIGLLLTQLLTRMDAITDALVASGLARYAP